MNEADIHRVMRSFGRCTVTEDFLNEFYRILTAQSDEIREMFNNTDMIRQRQLLKAAITHLISYATGNAFSERRVLELGESHSRKQLDVRPDLYGVWIESLLQAIRQFDEDCDEQTEAAWRSVLAPGIEKMKSMY